MIVTTRHECLHYHEDVRSAKCAVQHLLSLLALPSYNQPLDENGDVGDEEDRKDGDSSSSVPRIPHRRVGADIVQEYVGATGHSFVKSSAATRTALRFDSSLLRTAVIGRFMGLEYVLAVAKRIHLEDKGSNMRMASTEVL